MNKKAAHNSHLAKAEDYGNDTPGSSLEFVLHLIDLCFKIPAFAKRQNVVSNGRETDISKKMMNKTTTKRINYKEVWKTFYKGAFNLILIISLFPTITFAQPGPSGGMLLIKVYKDGKPIDLPNEDWQILPTNITLADSSAFIPIFIGFNEYPIQNDFYHIIPEPTPAGGSVGDDFYLDIVFKKDTMRIYPPNFRHQTITLDSIPFQKGVYKIPQSIYDLREVSKKDYNKRTVPSLYGNWNLFTGEQYKCYIEKTEDIDYETIYGRNQIKGKFDWRNWQYLYIRETGTSYYFYDNTIVKYEYDSKEISIYEVKDVLNTEEWGEIRIITLFYKNNTVFAIISKRNTYRGIYKLNFVDKI